MKEKTLYYRTIVREVGVMVNDGFIIATMYDGKIFSLEGVFTEDYFTAKINEDTITFEYYSKQEDTGIYEKEWEIPLDMEYFVLPIDLEALILDKDIDEIEEAGEIMEGDCKNIQIETIEEIIGESQKAKCNEILKKFKNNNNVFN